MKDSFRKQKGVQKVALVHDFLTSQGGAERVLQSLRKLYPEAPIYTLLSNKSTIEAFGIPPELVRTSSLQRWPEFLRRRPQWLLPFYPVAVESFDLREFDLVISSSGAWGKGIVTRLHTRHIAYFHSPMRFAWDGHSTYLPRLGLLRPLRVLGWMALSYLRVWDFGAADRPDVLIANSRFTQVRLKKYYRKESQVVYPPVLLPQDMALDDRKREYFLVVSRLTKSKRIDVAIEALQKLGLPLVIAGDGPERAALEKLAGKETRFLGRIPDSKLAELYRGARALVIPSEEDFGLVAVEALAFGAPVIAYGRGGVKEIIEDGVHGLYFSSDLPEILAEALMRFLAKEKEGGFDGALLQARARQFSEERFLEEIRRIIETERS